MLPINRDARNALPIWDGCMKYFPDAWAEIAKVSAHGAKQHGLGKLGWERSISTDHENKVMRHMLDHAAGATLDLDGCFHLAKAAWRILAALQLAIEAQAGVNSQANAQPQLGTMHGQIDCQNPQRDPNGLFCAAGAQIPNRGQEPRAERALQSLAERFVRGESDGPICGASQVPGHWKYDHD